MVCPESVPSDVQMCLQFLSSGGFMVSLTSGIKLQTFTLSVTALKSGASGVICSSEQVRGLAGFRSEAADLCGECYTSERLAGLKEQAAARFIVKNEKIKLPHCGNGPGWLSCFYSHPHPADWSILQRADWSVLQRADWSILTEC
uniref:Uncharacterized protein n=1 Tax=Macaca mulatta TaxID=9544 RepID=A0A5F8A771_MACMU